jgi:hypothetical protein
MDHRGILLRKFLVRAASRLGSGELGRGTLGPLTAPKIFGRV